MRRLYGNSLEVAFIEPGYTYCKCTNDMLKRLIHSKRSKRITHEDECMNKTTIFSMVNVSSIWIQQEKCHNITAGGFSKLDRIVSTDIRDTDIFNFINDHGIDANCPVLIEFHKKSVREFDFDMLQIKRLDSEYFLGIPWNIFDITYSYPPSIIRDNGLDLSMIDHIDIVLSSDEYSRVEYTFKCLNNILWEATMFIGNNKIGESIQFNDMIQLFDHIPESVMIGSRIYIYHRKNWGEC